jgi:hypothetical protein
MTCAGSDGSELGDGDLAAPVVMVTKVHGGPVPGPFGSAGQGTTADEFVFCGRQWQFNFNTGSLPGPGNYEISVTLGGSDLLLGAPVAILVIG